MASTFKIIISTPRGKVEDGECKQITFKTTEEVRGILANHSPFMGALKPHIMKIIREDGKVNYFNIDRGFIKFLDNRAIILTNSAVNIADITPASIIEDERRLQEIIKRESEDAARVKKIEAQLGVLQNLRELKDQT